MKHVIPHDLPMDLAKQACTKAMERYTKKFEDYQAKSTWTTDTHMDISFKAKGATLSAGMDLSPTELTIDMKVPLLFKPFQKKALTVIEEVIQKWIEKARRGELDEM